MEVGAGGGRASVRFGCSALCSLSVVTGTFECCRWRKSDGNEAGVRLLHNYHRMSMHCLKLRDDVSLNKAVFMMAIYFHSKEGEFQFIKT